MKPSEYFPFDSLKSIIIGLVCAAISLPMMAYVNFVSNDLLQSSMMIVFGISTVLSIGLFATYRKLHPDRDSTV